MVTPAFAAPSQLNLSPPAVVAGRAQRFEAPGLAEAPRAVIAIHWQPTDVPFVSPRIASLVRNFRHDGLPLVHLWESGRNLLAIGLDPRGKPSIYFTQHLPR
jgi:hypothetical protein